MVCRDGTAIKRMCKWLVCSPPVFRLRFEQGYIQHSLIDSCCWQVFFHPLQIILLGEQKRERRRREGRKEGKEERRKKEGEEEGGRGRRRERKKEGEEGGRGRRRERKKKEGGRGRNKGKTNMYMKTVLFWTCGETHSLG